jgi:polyisoprenoid-binding protein YceI
VSQSKLAREIDGIELPPVGTWKFDPAHTAVQFVARHILTKVRGRFTGFDGTIHVAERPEDSRVDVEIDAATLETNQDQRDQHLRSGDFLEVETYPKITFRSTEVRPTGGNMLEVVGDLTIKDVTRPVTLQAEYLGQSTNPYGKRVMGFSAHTTIDREDWDMTWNMVLETGGLLVSKNADLELEIEAILQD